MIASTFRLPFLTFFAFAIFFLQEPATAQEERVIRSSAEYVYGQTMRFNLSATGVGEVDKVTLFFRLGASPNPYAVDVPVTSGADLEASYPLDLSQTRLPPFGRITYWWRIERVDEGALLVPEQVVSYVDDQFKWQQLVERDEQGGGSLRIHWTGEGQALGETARDLIFEMLPRLSRLVPLEHILPFDVYIYPSTADLGAALRLAGRDYQPGQTYPDLGVVLTTVVNPETAEAELRDGLSRGLTDLLLYQAAGQFVFNLPPWLGRGLAGAVRATPDTQLENALRSALATGTTLSVAELCAGAPIDSDITAAQSEALVNYIATTYGNGVLRDMVVSFAEGADCNATLRNTLQQTPAQLEAAWLRSQREGETSHQWAETAVWGVLLLAGFGMAALLILRPKRP